MRDGPLVAVRQHREVACHGHQHHLSAVQLWPGRTGAFIGDNYIHLDHDQTCTGSAGAAYMLNMDTDHPTRLSMDAVLQTGLRASTATIPNGIALPTYGTVSVSAVQQLPTGTELRLDVLNVGDRVYQIRNGTDVGVGAPQYGLRRTVLTGVTQRF